ncbi:LacI family DNA-binding transcriptional regulator [Amaricoccus macauensis]|uniref:LacI family DNA-binding transcriptional regulator n=1 Tax=Amaricoccus macauensis TaxID=57001 RepID=UPI003C79C327
MSHGNATLKDLAKKLDVSIATVSRALSGQDRISPETRKRVEMAAREIGYCPNRAARALVSGQTGLAALVLPDRPDGGCAFDLGRMISNLSGALMRRGIDLLVTQVPPGRSDCEALTKLIGSRKADSIILTDIRENDPRLALLNEHRFPHVAFGAARPIADGGIPATAWVGCDAHGVAARATRLLLGHGHRRFALLRWCEPTLFRARWTAGVATALRAAGGSQTDLQVATLAFADHRGRLAEIRRLLGAPSRPTAILGLDDTLALEAIRVAEGMGLSVPEDLSVVGFGNLPAGSHSSPGLTSFDPDLARCADLLAEAIAPLIGRIRTGGSAVAERSVTPRLILRESHGAVPDGRPAASEPVPICFENV